ncbi:MAG TPA: hypothetical protein VFY26_11410, partial [Anaerolineales bacterium]|nr:hypothetical protein [Anaerolineales bacterium]
MKKSMPVIGILLAVLLAAVVIVNMPEPLVVFTATPGQLPTLPAILPSATASAATPIPAAVEIVFQPHTVNGYTATIESYSIDTANLIFLVRIRGGNVHFGDENFYGRIRAGDLYDENGNLINTSAGTGPSAGDPELIQLEFRPQAHLLGDRFQGQFGFDLESAPPLNETLARFRFDVDLPIHAPKIYHPKQAVTANGLE